MKKLFIALTLLAVNAWATDPTVGSNALTNGALNGDATGWTISGAPGGVDGNGGPGYTFSFSSGTIAQTYAINQALAGAGVNLQIHGFNYGFDYRFNCGQQIGSGCESNSLQDTLNATITITNGKGSAIYSQYYGLGSKNAADGHSAYNPNWQSLNTEQRFASPYNIDRIGTFTMSITGQDAGFWGGNYGPSVRNAYSNPVYSVIDPCVNNPATNPGCPGYNDIITSGNLLPGTSGQQVYAINQALMHSGSGLIIHGFNYGYTYDIGGMQCTAFNQDGSCSWQMASTASVTTRITDIDNMTIYNKVDSYTGPASGVKDVTYLFPQSLNTATLGTFRMTPGINGSGSITNMYSNAMYTPDPCVADPLSSTSCSGYAQAMLNQQCPANPLYDSACPGYFQAYTAQQCAISALYNPSCPGYAQALFTQQCTANPLQDPACPGYAAAYLNQQCSSNPLYSTTCSGYEQAYLTQQCNLDGLYSRQCPNYSESYAKKMVFEKQGIASIVDTAGTVAKVAAADPEKQAKAVSSDDNVNAAVTAKSTGTTSATAPAAPVKLVDSNSNNSQQGTLKEEKKPKGGQEDANIAGPKDGVRSEGKPIIDNKPKTNRDALAEQRREVVKKETVEKGKQLAKEMGRAPDMQAQMNVQNVVIQAMGFTPGFDSYNRFVLPDGQGYKPYSVYNNQRNVDSQAGRGLFGSSDNAHQKMVDAQYNLGN
jgi:hypothetical protein